MENIIGENIVGVSYPIPKEFMKRFFEGKDVFVKPATAWKRLKPGMKFVFYQSHEDTGFVGGQDKKGSSLRKPYEVL